MDLLLQLPSFFVGVMYPVVFFFFLLASVFIKLVRKINGKFFKSRGPRVSRNGKKVFESPPNVDDGFGDQS